MADPGPRPLGRVWSWLGLALTIGTMTLVVLAVRETRRGETALARSDAAFHSGNLIEAVRQARDAGLCYVPGAEHVERAQARLEAVARGAEAEGQLNLARQAWDALRFVDEATRYPGRADHPAGDRARAALKRLDAAGAGSRR